MKMKMSPARQPKNSPKLCDCLLCFSNKFCFHFGAAPTKNHINLYYCPGRAGGRPNSGNCAFGRRQLKLSARQSGRATFIHSLALSRVGGCDRARKLAPAIRCVQFHIKSHLDGRRVAAVGYLLWLIISETLMGRLARSSRRRRPKRR